MVRYLNPVITVTPRRTLHLIDVENLVGSGRPSAAEVAAGLDRYRAAVPVGGTDLVVLAANATTAAAAGWAWPGPLVRATRGPDGADLALLEECRLADVAGRFDRVVIASGDHLFARRIDELRTAGIRVEVVARPRSLARALRATAPVVRLLPEWTDTAVAA